MKNIAGVGVKGVYTFKNDFLETISSPSLSVGSMLSYVFDANMFSKGDVLSAKKAGFCLMRICNSRMYDIRISLLGLVSSIITNERYEINCDRLRSVVEKSLKDSFVGDLRVSEIFCYNKNKNWFYDFTSLQSLNDASLVLGIKSERFYEFTNENKSGVFLPIDKKILKGIKTIKEGKENWSFSDSIFNLYPLLENYYTSVKYKDKVEVLFTVKKNENERCYDISLSSYCFKLSKDAEYIQLLYKVGNQQNFGKVCSVKNFDKWDVGLIYAEK